MVISPDRLEQLHVAHLETQIQPFETIIEQVEDQIDHDLRGGWGEVQERLLDPRDPRSVRIEFTTELDPGLEQEIAQLEPAHRTLVEQEIQRRYLAAGYRSLTFLDDGRVRLDHVIGPAAERSVAPGSTASGHGTNGAGEGGEGGSSS